MPPSHTICPFAVTSLWALCATPSARVNSPSKSAQASEWLAAIRESRAISAPISTSLPSLSTSKTSHQNNVGNEFASDHRNCAVALPRRVPPQKQKNKNDDRLRKMRSACADRRRYGEFWRLCADRGEMGRLCRAQLPSMWWLAIYRANESPRVSRHHALPRGVCSRSHCVV